VCYHRFEATTRLLRTRPPSCVVASPAGQKFLPAIMHICACASFRFQRVRLESPNEIKISSTSSSLVCRLDLYFPQLVELKITGMIPAKVFWAVTPCSVAVGYKRFRGPCRLHSHPTSTIHSFKNQKTLT